MSELTCTVWEGRKGEMRVHGSKIFIWHIVEGKLWWDTDVDYKS